MRGLASTIAYLNVITALPVNSHYITGQGSRCTPNLVCADPTDRTDVREKPVRKKNQRKQPPAPLPGGSRTHGLTLRHNSSQLELNYIGDLGLPYIIDTLTAIPSDTEIYIRQQKRKAVRGYLCLPNRTSVSTAGYRRTVVAI